MDGVKIAVTDEEAKTEADNAYARMHVDIDKQCDDLMR